MPPGVYCTNEGCEHNFNRKCNALKVEIEWHTCRTYKKKVNKYGN